MKITVTLNDIAAGHRRDSKNCPVALALRRAGVNHCGVAGILVVVEQGDERVSVVLPDRVQEWIRDYDWGFAMMPFEFDFAVPEPRRKEVPAPRDLLPVVTLTAAQPPWRQFTSPLNHNQSELELVGVDDDAA